MPKRSTPFQAIVYFVRNHFAESGATVTESKLLRNAITGEDREVDIVIEGRFNDEPITISIEVIEHNRPANIIWAEAMLKKHEALSTNRLVLVSQAGFTRQALALIEAQSGRVEAVTPEIATESGCAVVRRIFVDHVTIRATGSIVHLIQRPENHKVSVDLDGDIEIYSLDGKPLGGVGVLVFEIVNLPTVKQMFLERARDHPERDELKAFKTLIPIPQLMYCLYHQERDQLDLIMSLDIRGELTYGREEVPLRDGRLGRRDYRFGQSIFAGHPTVWVETTDEERNRVTLSWRRTDIRPEETAATEYEYCFPAVRELPLGNAEPYPDDDH